MNPAGYETEPEQAEPETEPERRELRACGWCGASGLEPRADGSDPTACRFCHGEGAL